MIKSGKLDKEITIQSRGDSRNSYGESVASWSNKFSTYAHIKDLSGNELLIASQVNSRITTLIKIRWDSSTSATSTDNTVRSSDRVVWRSRNYNIVRVNSPNESDEILELYCERLESVANG